MSDTEWKPLQLHCRDCVLSIHVDRWSTYVVTAVCSTFCAPFLLWKGQNIQNNMPCCTRGAGFDRTCNGRNFVKHQRGNLLREKKRHYSLLSCRNVSNKERGVGQVVQKSKGARHPWSRRLSSTQKKWGKNCHHIHWKSKTGQSYNLNNLALWPTLTQSGTKAQVKPKSTIPASFW